MLHPQADALMETMNFQPIAPLNPKPCFLRRRRLNSLSKPGHAQEWLYTRFEGLLPTDVIGNLHFVMYSAQNLMAPPAFRENWNDIAAHHRGSGMIPAGEYGSLSHAKVLLVLADLSDETEMQDVNHLFHFVQHFFKGKEDPHIILLHHSATRSRFDINEVTQTMHVSDALRARVDIIVEEIVGFKLAWAVQNRLIRQNVAASQVQKCISEKCVLLQKIHTINSVTDYSLWVHLRLRLDTHLPPVDLDIERGEPRAIDGFQVGDVLGSGSCGRVSKLMQDGGAVGQVLKTMPKHRITNVRGVKALGVQIEVMQLLSSKSWKHPHIIQLLGIYHSETHILFRLVDGGSRDLHKRLQHRDNRHSPLSPLSSRKVRSIISQVSSAICFMHTGPKIAHCDIKPENIIVSETAEDLHVSIADFDMAVVRPSAACRGVVGTFPFIAPEIFFEATYNPFVADVWSMGVVFLEVACCLRVLERALRLRPLPKQAPHAAVELHQKHMTGIIHDHFCQDQATKQILKHHLHPKLHDMASALMSFMPQLLVSHERRAASSQVLEGLRSEQWFED